jgi:hypothetical protein
MSKLLSFNLSLVFVFALWISTLTIFNNSSFVTSVVEIDEVSAQTATPSPTSTAEVQNIPTQEISGTILRIEGQTLSVDSEDGVRTVTVNDNVSINRNGTQATFSELEVNDDVEIVQTQTGELLSVAATSSEVGTATQLAIPLLLVGLAVIGAFLFLRRKMNAQHIKTDIGEVDTN